jgi:hypothetical protein
VARNDVYTCSSCNTTRQQRLTASYLQVCIACGQIIQENIPGFKRPTDLKMPEDWSFVQIGTTGEFKKQPFEIIGRIRLQLRNDYKNLWCAAYEQGKAMWIAESFASFAVFTSPLQTFEENVSKLRAGASIQVNRELKLTGEFVEKCEGISLRGELAEWKLFAPGFFLIQASRAQHTALFFPEGSKQAQMIVGEKVPVETLNFKNILEWNEWK